jgi:hypothetical protein
MIVGFWLQEEKPLLPVGVAFRILEHAEHVAAMISLHSHLATSMGAGEQRAAVQAAFQAVLSQLGEPRPHRDVCKP